MDRLDIVKDFNNDMIKSDKIVMSGINMVMNFNNWAIKKITGNDILTSDKDLDSQSNYGRVKDSWEADFIETGKMIIGNDKKFLTTNGVTRVVKIEAEENNNVVKLDLSNKRKLIIR